MSMTGNWGKSSHSTAAGNCLEARWAKSSYTGINGPHCVEARLEEAVQVRDSKLGEASPVLQFSAADWQNFVNGLK